MEPTNKATTQLQESECWALVRSVPVGRLAVVVDGQPDIFPVNHVVDQGTVVIRTGSGTKHTAAGHRPVAFEVDGYDAVRSQAWSVVIKGTARTVDQLHEVVDALQLPLFPWQEGAKPWFLRIEPDSVSGRRVQVSGPQS
ncbi:pyridoxamine 5'-phosphate oxidase family protein [Flexivirga caeni]|uniref:Pyridoxamine 5'-phosphate oxidase family protein n=1 Tax=Flexivirga caeni TaxID=2294115 RepID=A0A3M9M2U9_9MICO|nr:pyridoxamine 5'-phosphate oxidase family protein [Flexivirga caeni]RNI19465.1 pyridoxamine 5'-phosphate oxidase family protein [Flexivirga caeni]